MTAWKSSIRALSMLNASVKTPCANHGDFSAPILVFSHPISVISVPKRMWDNPKHDNSTKYHAWAKTLSSSKVPKVLNQSPSWECGCKSMPHGPLPSATTPLVLLPLDSAWLHVTSSSASCSPQSEFHAQQLHFGAQRQIH